MYYLNLLGFVLAVGLAMTKTISSVFSQTLFSWSLNHIHLILLQLKTQNPSIPQISTVFTLTDEKSSFNPIQPLPCLRESTALNNQRRNTASLSSFPGDKSSLNGAECKSFLGTREAPALFRYTVKCCQGGMRQVRDVHLAWWCTEPCRELPGFPRKCRCERSTGSCQQRGGISWSDADRGCLQAAGAQLDWHPVYSQMTSGPGMSVTGILIHLAMWKLPWNTVWWSLCRVHITRIIEEFQNVWAPIIPATRLCEELAWN